MPFSRNTLEVIVNRITNDFLSRITDATSLLRRSVLRVMAKVVGGAFHLMYEYLDYMARQLFATTADEAGLEAHASEYGLSRNTAVQATGTGTATGVNGSIIPAGTQLISTDNITYMTDADATIAAGTATIDFTAEDGGEDGNDDPGVILTFVTPVVGVDTDFTVDSDGIINGTDEETDDALRARVLTRKRQPPHGGADFDYEVWAKEVSGVTRAWSIPLYLGPGTVAVLFVRDNDTTIIPNATQLAAVRAYILEHDDPGTGKTVGAPVTVEPGLYVLAPTALTVNFSIKIYPNTSVIQAAIESELEDLILREGGPGETLYLSRISEAISLATGEDRHTLLAPAADVTASSTEIHVLGTVTFSNY